MSSRAIQKKAKATRPKRAETISAQRTPWVATALGSTTSLTASCQSPTYANLRGPFPKGTKARLRSLSEVFAQPRDRIANLSSESRIDILDVGEKAAANVFDLRQRQPGLFDLSNCSNHDPRVCANHLTG
jgi:hypothetical protein